MTETAIERPAGVMILAILMIVAGILNLLGGLSYAWTVLFGILSIVVGWGLWNLQKWGYQIAMVLSIIGGIFGLLLTVTLILAIIGLPILIIYLIIIYYLTRPEIKDIFGITGFIS